MNDSELTRRVRSAVSAQCQQRGYAAPVDVLMDIGALDKKKYEDWRYGRVPYLESVCCMNLHKLARVMHEIRVCAEKAGLKPSWCCYKRWGGKKKAGKGQGPGSQLRFSKSGNEHIERWYATHFVDKARIAQLKAEAAKNPGTPVESTEED